VFKALVGVPCPTCASTRSVVYLSHGDVASAFFMNPLVLSVSVAALVYLFYSLLTFIFAAPRIVVALSGNEKDRLRVLAVLLVLVNWLYLFLTL
jgi:fumarate reductase subunit C